MRPEFVSDRRACLVKAKFRTFQKTSMMPGSRLSFEWMYMAPDILGNPPPCLWHAVRVVFLWCRFFCWNVCWIHCRNINQDCLRSYVRVPDGFYPGDARQKCENLRNERSDTGISPYRNIWALTDDILPYPPLSVFKGRALTNKPVTPNGR